jgi:hypothetical protein
MLGQCSATDLYPHPKRKILRRGGTEVPGTLEQPRWRGVSAQVGVASARVTEGVFTEAAGERRQRVQAWVL